MNLELAWQLGCGAILLAALVTVVVWQPMLGLGGLILVPVLGPALRAPLLSPSVVAFGEAALAVGLLLALFGRWASGSWRPRGPVLVALGLLGLWTLSVIRGVARHGPLLSLQESYVWLVLIVAVMVAASSPTISRLVVPIWILAAVMLSGFAILGLVTTGFASSAAKVVDGGLLVDSRPVTASGALIVGQAMILAGTRLKRSRWSTVLVLWLALVTILLQHRTVWVALAAGAAVVLANRSAHLLPRLAPLLLVSPVGAILLLRSGVLAGVTGALDTSWQNALAPGSSYDWRLEGWRQLLARNDGFDDWLLGRPFGEGYAREIYGQLVTFTPHSHYVESLVRMGLLAVVLTVLLWRRALAGARSVAAQLRTHPSAVPALIVTQVLFAVTYRLDVTQFVLLGAMLAPVVVKAGTPDRIPGGSDAARDAEPAAVPA